MKPVHRRCRSALGALPFLLLAGCEEAEQVLDHYRDLTPHEAYLESLRTAGLAETALGRDWTRAAEAALTASQAVALPFQEEGYLPPEEPTAVGYRITLDRGRVLRARVEVDGGDSLRLFLDLFRVPSETDAPLRPVLSADTVAGALTYEPYRGGEYILRLQPELLRGGRYRLVLTLDASLAFPVEGVDDRAVHSSFGADRDGGRRRHNGVDIFAPRGTPALAAAEGVVTRVNTTRLGGNVVWIRDARRSARLYYAHLDTQLVARGDRVRVGDTVGLVGNTGNAITTPPHLHFGVYIDGPTDPLPFIRPARRTPPRVAGSALVGAWVRARASVALRDRPGEDGSVTAELSRHAPLRVTAGAGRWYRVGLPDGRSGWVPVASMEAVGSAIRDLVADRRAILRARPDASAPVVAGIEPGTTLPVFGAFGGFALVETPLGRRGWMSEGG